MTKVRVKAVYLILGVGVPDDARPGDLIVGNRGAAAEVLCSKGVLYLHHVGNVRDPGVGNRPRRRIYDFR